MADAKCGNKHSLVSDGEQPAAKPPPKRRRILDPSAIVSVPVYSNKVSSSLQLMPTAAMVTEKADSDDGADATLWSPFSSPELPGGGVVALSDSDDESELTHKKTQPFRAVICCPSPPKSPVQKQSSQVQQKISEINRKLRAVNSLLSPDPQDRRPASRRGQDDADIIAIPGSGPEGSPCSSSLREIPLKIRCRIDVHKIPVLSSTPLSDVVSQLSVILSVPPPRLMLLREEAELPTDSTVGELGLGIADIIECVVMAAEDNRDAGSITVRLQSKDRDSSQEFTVHRDAPLGSIFSQYLSKMSASVRRRARFQFDGCKVTHDRTPSQLDMEDGDIIEVWI